MSPLPTASRLALAEDDPRHGTVNGYVNRRCRCDRCREAWRNYEPAKTSALRYRRRLGMMPRQPAKPMEHGTYYAYTKGCCRCDECRMASRHYKRRLREAQGMRPNRKNLP